MHETRLARLADAAARNTRAQSLYRTLGYAPHRNPEILFEKNVKAAGQ